MRKSLLFVAFLLLSVFMVNAEELTSKKGTPILPKAGDVGVSIDATPILNYVGNFIGGNGFNVAPTFDFVTPNQSFVFKYYIEDNKAIRLGLVLGYNSTVNYTEVPALPITAPITYVNNKTINSNSSIGISGGLEWRRGIGRLFGFYGGEVGLAASSSGWTYKYGNKLSDDNPLTNRTASTNAGITLGLGARGFVGVEYFILPKISLAGEFGWGAQLGFSGRGTTKTQSWDAVKKVVDTDKTKTGSQSMFFTADNENNSTIFGPAGQLKLSFHF